MHLILTSNYVLTTDLFDVLQPKYYKRAVVSRNLDSGHVFADSVAVDVVRADAGHQFVGHIVGGDCVLVVRGILVVLVSNVDESGGIIKRAAKRPAPFH
ncbi:hypothetical protein BG842_15640 [Haladaptatus sp. W1]|nr:hypothetical protein BG842_15640 [Haladaptatus sp. W1]